MKHPLTNFSPSELPFYQKAVETSPQPGLSIDMKPSDFDGQCVPNPRDHSLWYDGEGGCDVFWDHFDKLAKEQQ